MTKRMIEILFAALLLLLLSPLFILICIVLKLTGEKQIFYRQERVGQNGKPIRLTKFVTMVRDSLAMGTRDITVRNDPRVLPIGRFLRKTKLNELPQLWDVVGGKLSIVGWRPLMESGFTLYPTDVQETLKTIKPGLTGIGSLVFRDEESIIAKAAEQGRDLRDCYRQDIMPYKGALEVWYIENKGLWTDIRIIAGTAIAVLKPGWTGFYGWFGDLPLPKSEIVSESLGVPMDPTPSKREE